MGQAGERFGLRQANIWYDPSNHVLSKLVLLSYNHRPTVQQIHDTDRIEGGPVYMQPIWFSPLQFTKLLGFNNAHLRSMSTQEHGFQPLNVIKD